MTGCGCVMIEGNEKNEGKDGRRAKENASESTEKCWTGKIASQISTLYLSCHPRKIVDMQMRDSMNMGAGNGGGGGRHNLAEFP